MSAAIERTRRFGGRLRQRLRRRPTVVTGQTKGLHAALEINVAGEVTPGKEPSLAAMTRRLYEFEDRLRGVEAAQERQAGELKEQVDALQEAVQEMIRRSKDQYLGLRIVGLATALTGAVLLSAANLVPA